jgi:hypothetical protein
MRLYLYDYYNIIWAFQMRKGVNVRRCIDIKIDL